MGKDGHNHSIWNRISLQQAKAITSRSSKIRRGNQNCRKRWPEPHQWIWTAPWRAAGSDECDLKKKPGNTGKPTSKRRKKTAFIDAPRRPASNNQKPPSRRSDYYSLRSRNHLISLGFVPRGKWTSSFSFRTPATEFRQCGIQEEQTNENELDRIRIQNSVYFEETFSWRTAGWDQR